MSRSQVINGATAASPGDTGTSMVAKMKPALGLTMTFLTDVTLFLSPARSIAKTGSKDDHPHPEESAASACIPEPINATEDLREVYIVEILRSRSNVSASIAGEK